MKKTLLALLLLVLGCTQTLMVEAGDTVSLDYTGSLSDGTVFDTSVGREPLVFTAGMGEMIPGFDNAVLGMSAGEEKTFTIPASDAYGEVMNDLILSYDKSVLAGMIGEEPVIGMGLQANNGLSGVITSVNDSFAVIDFNHPLAGKDLTFNIVILDVQKP